MIDGQMELSLVNARGCRPLSRRQRHLSRAQWWFERMRQAVDRAVEWDPAAPARAQQALLPGPSPQGAAAEERQMCA